MKKKIKKENYNFFDENPQPIFFRKVRKSYEKIVGGGGFMGNFGKGGGWGLEKS